MKKMNESLVQVEEKDGALVKLANTLTNAAVNGVGPLESSRELAKQYLDDKSYRSNKARAESLVRWEMSKNFGTGFLTGLGGFTTLPITLPAGIGAAWAVQARMVGAIAEIYGWSVDDERVKTMILLCLIGSDMSAVLKSCGVKLGQKIGEKLIGKLPAKVLVEINKKVGFRLITKAGERGIVNLTKAIPLIGGGISGVVDAMACKAVGKAAIKVFARRTKNACSI